MLCVTTRPRILHRASSLRRCFRSLWNQILACTLGKSCTYRQLPRTATMSSLSLVALERGLRPPTHLVGAVNVAGTIRTWLLRRSVSWMIPKLGKLTEYVGGERQEEGFEISDSRLNQMDKTHCVGGARIAYRIWEVARDETSQNHIPSACKDSVAMLFMFDLTSWCTLHSIIGWYQESRKWNQTAIPVLIGTKFDDFVQLPIDVQWTIATRAYARALNATLFFSSATYNINVNKIFKFITAKLFNLPWAPEVVSFEYNEVDDKRLRSPHLHVRITLFHSTYY
ncbi:hypothetical protein HYC85_012174 [Camellia sinensis]|uniref:Uncharacterized protein n=1 Tax=Camellia sinensis TaxID=4442 RepID=A0A7J7HD99_CAMSI|nr:hypothetical protein HYC85_012174 [Camellia sinensis]